MHRDTLGSHVYCSALRKAKQQDVWADKTAQSFPVHSMPERQYDPIVITAHGEGRVFPKTWILPVDQGLENPGLGVQVTSLLLFLFRPTLSQQMDKQCLNIFDIHQKSYWQWKPEAGGVD